MLRIISNIPFVLIKSSFPLETHEIYISSSLAHEHFNLKHRVGNHNTHYEDVTPNLWTIPAASPALGQKHSTALCSLPMAVTIRYH